MVDKLVDKSLEYLMNDIFKRIESGKYYDISFKPYEEKIAKKVLKFFEMKEEFEKCKIIHDFITDRFNHESNYKI